MKIKVSRNSGFCFGVNRAVNAVFEVIKAGNKCCTLGPIVHNTNVVNLLKKCGNIITATSEAAITCCGSKLEAMEPKKADESEMLSVEDTGDEWYISSEHSMTKEHYISLVAAAPDGGTARLR